ncbi:MAG: lysylphosphatidylglycerol synthase transmembrane domain-containing protein [Gemmatimonadota bacterium]|nr:lysylphosphatidylglycerol synthase transmembrane domain-containing protein [Gemmatimonadota bacterium]
MKHWGKALLGLVITVLLLWWALSGVAFGEVWANIRRGNLWLLGASVVVATSGFFIRALRWHVLLVPVKADTRLRSRFAGVSIGFMANNIFPARVGEFARAYTFSRMEPVSASAAFGSLVIERLMDGIILLAFLVWPVLTPGFPVAGALSEGWGSALLRAGFIGIAAVLGVMIWLSVWPRPFVRTVEWVAKFLPHAVARPLVDSLEAFLDSVAILRRPRLLLAGALWSLFFWTWHGLSFWLGLLAFGIDTGFVSAIFTEAVVGFGVAIPSAPGFFGTFHAAAKFALSDIYAVPEAQALAFAFGYHFGGWLPITLIGLWYAWRLGLSIGEVGTAAERVEEEVEGAHPGALNGEMRHVGTGGEPPHSGG